MSNLLARECLFCSKNCARHRYRKKVKNGRKKAMSNFSSERTAERPKSPFNIKKNFGRAASLIDDRRQAEINFGFNFYGK